MIYDASGFGRDVTLRADLCVVGTGAGGSMAATVAAEAGLSVVVLEAGAFMPPEYMSQREEDMIPQLLWDNGGRTTRDRAVKIHQGHGVGGSTLHNLNLCARIPAPVRDEWQRTRDLQRLDAARWDDLYGRVETMLEVSAPPREDWNRHNLLLEQACQVLGWAYGGMRHNRTGCTGSGFCEVGCAFDAKNNAAKVLVPRLVAAGGRVVSRCQAVRLQNVGGRVRAVEAVALDPMAGRPSTRVTVEADRVAVASSATGTPALLLRSGIAGPDGSTGETLRIHPALVAAGVFDEPVQAWMGIPQTVECREFLDFESAHPASGPVDEPPIGSRTWIVPAFAHPVGTATMMPGYGADHRALMLQYAHTAVLTNMLHDFTAGRVRPRGPLGVSIDYWPNAHDRRELVFGVARAAEALFAAGARQVAIPTSPVTELRSPADLRSVEAWELTRGMLDVTAVHPMGSVPMGADPSVAAVDDEGRHHHVDGLWVADGSLFPTSIGGPPQLSIYALGLHVGEAIARS